MHGQKNIKQAYVLPLRSHEYCRLDVITAEKFRFPSLWKS